MLFCMRTTLDLDDELMRALKRQAAESGETMTSLIEDAVRKLLAPPKPPGKKRYRLNWRPVTGEGLLPGVDLNDRDRLYDVMEGLV